MCIYRYVRGCLSRTILVKSGHEHSLSLLASIPNTLAKNPQQPQKESHCKAKVTGLEAKGAQTYSSFQKGSRRRQPCGWRVQAPHTEYFADRARRLPHMENQRTQYLGTYAPSGVA